MVTVQNSMDLMLSSKRALITGASRGIGFAICSKLSEEGAKPWLIARSKKEQFEIEDTCQWFVKTHERAFGG